MKKLVFFVAALSVLLSACSSEDNTAEPAEKGKAALTISLAKETPSTYASGTPTQVEENVIKNFRVFVFANGALEKVEDVTNALVHQINGLTTGNKEIFVVTNVPASFPVIAVGDSDSQLTSALVSLDTQQDLSTTGLLMSGEGQIQLLAAPAANKLSLTVSRIVAKIKLGTITYAPEAGFTGTFELVKVHVTKVPSKMSLGFPTLTPSGDFWGGVEGTSSTPVVTGPNVKPFLSEAITLAAHADKYFYVFPSVVDADKTILITLEATYDGVKQFYPFRVNESGTGTKVIANTSHTVNVTIKRPGAGTTDPEAPSDPATLEVTIVAEDWTVIPTQEVEW